MPIPSKSVKLAGPDKDNRFLVVSTKNTLLVVPGDVYTYDTVKRDLLPRTKHATGSLDVSFIQPRLSDLKNGCFPGNTLVKIG